MTTRDYMAIAPPPGVRIAYGPAPEQFGDLRLPAGAGPHPIVVVFHGGWWRAGYDLAYAGHLSAALTAAGYATWNIEYRRVGNPGGGYPGTLSDAALALAALRELAPAHRLDLARIVATGHSAGGHLAAWLAAKPARRDLDAFGPTPPLLGAVAVAGVLDLERIEEITLVDSTGGRPVRDLLGGTPASEPARYALASPIRQLPTGVPVIAVHGDADANVPLEISQRYVARARAAGDPASLIVLPGIDHFAPFDPATDAGRTVQTAIGDIFRHARPQTDAPSAGS
jgi:acetyl esterase/lipase